MKKKKIVFGILGFVFGIISLLLIFIEPFIGIPLSIAGFVISIIGCGKGKGLKGLAIAGIVLNSFGFIICIIAWIAEVDEYGKKDTTTSISTEIKASKSEKETDSSYDTQIEKQKLYDENGLSIVATGFYDDHYSDPGVDVTIQNNSAKDCIVHAMYSSVNGIMVSSSIDSNNAIPSGKTLNTKIAINRKIIEMANIKSINTLSFVFSIDDPQTYQTIAASEIISLGDSEKRQDLSKLSSGKLYENDDITVDLIGTENNNRDITLAIRNKTDQNYVFLTSAFSVNDYVVEDIPTFSGGSDSLATAYSCIFPYNTILMKFNLSDTSISKNNITNLNGYEFTILKCINEDITKTLQTDPIKISFK